MLVPTPRGRMVLVPIPDEPRAALAARGRDRARPGHRDRDPPVVPARRARSDSCERLRRWAGTLPAPRVLLGDLNLPGGCRRRVTGWRRLADVRTFPAHDPRVQLDHALADGLDDAVRGRRDDRARPGLGPSRRRGRPQSPLAVHSPLSSAVSAASSSRSTGRTVRPRGGVEERRADPVDGHALQAGPGQPVRRELDRPGGRGRPVRLRPGLPVDDVPAAVGGRGRPRRSGRAPRCRRPASRWRPRSRSASGSAHSLARKLACSSGRRSSPAGPSSAAPGSSRTSTIAVTPKRCSTQAWNAVPRRASGAGGRGIGRRRSAASASGSSASRTSRDADRWVGSSTATSSERRAVALGEQQLDLARPSGLSGRSGAAAAGPVGRTARRGQQRADPRRAGLQRVPPGLDRVERPGRPAAGPAARG